MNKKLFILNIVLFCCTLLFSCKKDDDSNNPSPSPSQPAFNQNTLPETSMKIDGVSVSYKQGVSNIWEGLSENASIGGVTNKSIVGAYWYKDNDPNPIEELFSVDKGTILWTPASPPDSAMFVSFFAPGNYQYTTATYQITQPTTYHGIEIIHTDSNGMQWSTAFGSADQTGSSFTILQTYFYRFNGDKYVKVKFTFNCKVYDDNGNMKTITDGNAIMDFSTEYGD